MVGTDMPCTPNLHLAMSVSETISFESASGRFNGPDVWLFCCSTDFRKS